MGSLPHHSFSPVCRSGRCPAPQCSSWTARCHRSPCWAAIKFAPFGERPAGYFPSPLSCCAVTLRSSLSCRATKAASPSSSPAADTAPPRSADEIRLLRRRIISVLRHPALVARRMHRDPWILGLKASSPQGHWTTTIDRAKSWSCARSHAPGPCQRALAAS
jgi:hypothetical protein